MDCTGKKDENKPKTSAISALFARLTIAREVCVLQSTRIAQLLLAPTGSGRVLPSMVILSVEDDFEGWKNPFDPSHFTNLRRYRSLNWLDYEVNRPLATLGRYKSPSSLPRIELGGLNLFGYLNGNPAVNDLISSCPYLASLLVMDKHLDKPNNIAPLLASARVPSNLTFLSVGEVSPGDEDISLALTPFTDIEKLELRASSFTSALIPVLHSMQHLTSIFFAPFAEVSCDDLVQLVGPMKPPKLEDIKISKVFQVEEFDEWEGYRYKVDQGWTSEFSRAALETNVLPAAKAGGVKLSGYAVEVIEKAAAQKARREEAKKMLQQSRRQKAAQKVSSDGAVLM
jgi:hypothetical protein